MDSAADRVFSIPELLEHILLYLDNATQSLSIAHSKTLFSLQRVNRSFNGTIRGSKRLQWRMGTARPLSDDAELVSANQMLTPYLERRELKVGPFHYRDISTSLQHRSSWIQFSIYADGLDQGPSDFNAAIEILGRSRRLYDSQEESWRQIHLTRISGSTLVNIAVKVRDPCKPHSNDYEHYTENLFDSENPITLGQLADMLRSVKHRTLFQHKVLAYCDANGGDSSEWDHKVTDKFLKGASMYLAWMRFEPNRDLAKMKKVAAVESTPVNICLILMEKYKGQVAQVKALELQLKQLKAEEPGIDDFLAGSNALGGLLVLWAAYVVASFFLFST